MSVGAGWESCPCASRGGARLRDLEVGSLHVLAPRHLARVVLGLQLLQLELRELPQPLVARQVRLALLLLQVAELALKLLLRHVALRDVGLLLHLQLRAHRLELAEVEADLVAHGLVRCVDAAPERAVPGAHASAAAHPTHAR